MDFFQIAGWIELLILLVTTILSTHLLQTTQHSSQFGAAR